MNIFGIGTDIVNIKRIKQSLKNKRFIERIYDVSEILKCNKQINKVSCLAKRFAAKEAFSKSLGTGFRNNLNFKDIVLFI